MSARRISPVLASLPVRSRLGLSSALAIVFASAGAAELAIISDVAVSGLVVSGIDVIAIVVDSAGVVVVVDSVVVGTVGIIAIGVVVLGVCVFEPGE